MKPASYQEALKAWESDPIAYFAEAAEAVDWLQDTLQSSPETAEDKPVELSRPMGLPEALLTALDTKFSTMAGGVKLAYLAGVTYESGRRGHLLAFIDYHDIPGMFWIRV